MCCVVCRVPWNRGATHSLVQAINNGLDQQMPDDSFFSNEKLAAAINAGQISSDRIDDAVSITQPLS